MQDGIAKLGEGKRLRDYSDFNWQARVAMSGYSTRASEQKMQIDRVVHQVDPPRYSLLPSVHEGIVEARPAPENALTGEDAVSRQEEETDANPVLSRLKSTSIEILSDVQDAIAWTNYAHRHLTPAGPWIDRERLLVSFACIYKCKIPVEKAKKQQEKREESVKITECNYYALKHRRRNSNIINPRTGRASDRNLSNLEKACDKHKIRHLLEKVESIGSLQRQEIYRRCRQHLEVFPGDEWLLILKKALVNDTGEGWNNKEADGLMSFIEVEDFGRGHLDVQSVVDEYAHEILVERLQKSKR